MSKYAVPRSNGADSIFPLALRIEWAKARARSMRWSEEVDLLEEEMRRVLQFLTWRAGWWDSQSDRRGLEEGAQCEGEAAYAARQAAVQRSLHDSFVVKWAPLPELIRRGRAGESVGDVEDKWEDSEMGSTTGDDGDDEDDEDLGNVDDEDVGPAPDSDGSEIEPIPESDGRAVKSTYIDS